jgi:hypothetical protein
MLGCEIPMKNTADGQGRISEREWWINGLTWFKTSI